MEHTSATECGPAVSAESDDGHPASAPVRIRLARNFITLAGAELASKILTFITFAYLARMLGVIEFGYVEFAVAVSLCAGLIVDLGFAPYGAREIAKDSGRTRDLVSDIVVARGLLACSAYGVVLVIAFVMDLAPPLRSLLILYGLSLFPMCLLLQWVFQGYDRMQTVAMANVLRQVLFAVVVLALLRSAERLWLVAVAEIVAVTGSAAYCLWAYRKHLKLNLRLRLHLSKQLFLEGIPIGLSQIFWALRLYGGTLILGLIVEKEQAGDVGLFGGALRILIAAHTFVWLYYYNLLPSFSRAWRKCPEDLRRIAHRSMHVVAWGSSALGLCWLLLAPRLMTLAYGDEFHKGGIVLQWLAAVCILAALSGNARFALVAANRQTLGMIAAGVGAAVTFVLIPIGYHQFGLTGAALGLVAAETVASVAAWWFAHRTLQLTGQSRCLVSPAFATVLASFILWLVPVSSDIAQCVIAVGVLALCLWLFDKPFRNPAWR